MLVKLLINALAVVITSYLLKDNVRIDSFLTAIIVAAVLGVINTIIKPILHILTLPFNIITLGLFSFVLNGALILLVDEFISGFNVNGLLWAVVFSLLLSLVSSILHKLT